MAEVLRGTINILVAKDDGTGNPLYKALYPKTSTDQIENFATTVDYQIDTKINAIPNATSLERGLVTIGNNITNSAGTISLTQANIINALGFTPLNESAAALASQNAQTANALATPRVLDGVSFDGTKNISHYTTCSTAADTVEKTVSCQGFTLTPGATITITFTTGNVAPNPLLNVNNTGAKQIQYRNAVISAGALAADRTYMFVYNGANYQLIGDLDTNDPTQELEIQLGNETTAHTSGRVIINKNTIGLSNVNNTADEAKKVLTAKTLETPVNISLIGAVQSTAVSFDGSADVSIPTSNLDVSKVNAGTLSVIHGGTGETSLDNVSVGHANTADSFAISKNITISDSTGEHTSTQVAFNGSADTNLKLPSTIKADVLGNATTATTAINCSGNAATATYATYDASESAVEDKKTIEQKYAKINSPAFSGIPTVPTPVISSDMEQKQVANVEYVNKAGVRFGICSSLAGASEKAVECEGFTLTNGSTIIVKFINTNTVLTSNLTLNVNSTGAKKMILYQGLDMVPSGSLQSGKTYMFVYDGSNWCLVGDVNTNKVTTVNGKTGDVTVSALDLGLENFSNKKPSELDVKSAVYDSAGNQISSSFLPIKGKAASAATADYASEAAKATNDVNGSAIHTTYAPINTPVFTGTPQVKKSDGTEILATINDVATQVNQLVGANVAELSGKLAEIQDILDDNGEIQAFLNGKQPLHDALTSISGLDSNTFNNETFINKMLYTVAPNTYQLSTISEVARNMLAKTSAEEIRSYLNAVGTTDVIDKATNATNSTYAQYDEEEKNKASNETKIAFQDKYVKKNDPIFTAAPFIEAELTDSNYYNLTNNTVATAAFVNKKFETISQANAAALADLNQIREYFQDKNGDDIITMFGGKLDKSDTVNSIQALKNLRPYSMLYTYGTDDKFKADSFVNYLKALATEMVNIRTELDVYSKSEVDQVATSANTHSVTKLVVGEEASNANTAVNSGNVYLRLFDDETPRGNVQLKSGTNVKITSDNNGTISFEATDTTYSDASTDAHGLMSVADKQKLDKIAESADAVSFTQTKTSGTEIGKITINGTATTLYGDENTHSTTKLVAGGSTSTTNTAVTSGNIYLRLFDDETHRGNIQLSAGTNMSIVSDANGVVTFNATATNVSYSPQLTTGAKIGTITINSIDTDIYGPENTDEKVKQEASTANTDLPLLLAYSTTAETATTRFNTKVKVNPSTGTLTATTFSGNASDVAEKDDTDTSQKIANVKYVRKKIADLVNGAPEALDTLNELATAIGKGDLSTSLLAQIGSKQDGNESLTSIAGLNTKVTETVDDKTDPQFVRQVLYTTAENTYDLAPIRDVGFSILAAKDAAAVRSTIGAVDKDGEVKDAFYATFDDVEKNKKDAKDRLTFENKYVTKTDGIFIDKPKIRLDTGNDTYFATEQDLTDKFDKININAVVYSSNNKTGIAQAHSEILDGLSLLATAENQILYTTAKDKFNVATITEFGRELLGKNDTNILSYIGALSASETADSATYATYDASESTADEKKTIAEKFATNDDMKGRMPKPKIGSITIPASAWHKDSTDASDSGEDNATWYAQIANEDVTNNSTVEVYITLLTQGTAFDARVRDINDSFDGYFKLYAEKAPTGDIEIKYYIFELGSNSESSIKAE